MKSVANIDEAVKLAKTFKKKGEIVLVGGCFDILHFGHLVFLEKAKSKGDFLIVLLESDQTIKTLKGEGRPFNTLDHRAKLLAALRVVDLVVILPPMTGDNSYDKLVEDIQPDIIATTKGDQAVHHKKRQAKLVGAKLIEVTNRIAEKSSTKIQKLISEDL